MTAAPAAVAVLGGPEPVVADEQPRARYWPGVLAGALGLLGAVLAHRFVPALGVLTWAVALGMVAGNTGMLRGAAKQGLNLVTKRLLRIGIVLLGFSVSFGAIAALGLGTIGLVAATLVITLVVTTWLGNRARLGRLRCRLSPLRCRRACLRRRRRRSP